MISFEIEIKLGVEMCGQWGLYFPEGGGASDDIELHWAGLSGKYKRNITLASLSLRETEPRRLYMRHSLIKRVLWEMLISEWTEQLS